MNFDRNWTSFALDAEVEAFGTSRIASAHNKLRAEVADLRKANERFGKRQDWWNERMFVLETERDRLRELLRSLRSVVMEDYRHLIDSALKEGS